jgi:hypothetical protein
VSKSLLLALVAGLAFRKRLQEKHSCYATRAELQRDIATLPRDS